MSTATSALTRAAVYSLLLRNQEALERAILAIQARQTSDEQAEGITRYQNGMGWNGRDASKGGSLAQWITNGTTPRPKGYGKKIGSTLTRGQRIMALRMIRKYTAQLLAVAEANGRAVDYDDETEMAPPPDYAPKAAPQPVAASDPDEGDAWGADDEVGF